MTKLLKEGTKLVKWNTEHLTSQNANSGTVRIGKQADKEMFNFKCKRVKEKTASVMVAEKETPMDINEAHKKLGHVCKENLQETMKSYNIKGAGKLKACDGCMRAEAKATSVPKLTKTLATIPGERLYLDTTGPFAPLAGGTVYDVKMVDQYLRKTFGAHVKKKSQVSGLVGDLLVKLKGKESRCNIFDVTTPANTKKT